MANPTRGAQRIVPYLTYADASAAIDFLCKAFGFEEQFRLDMDDGRIGHAELSLDGNVLMLASAFPEMGLQSPAELPALHCQVHIEVEDVDAHFARAREAGATIAAAPEDQPYGDRNYRASDPEGHRWIFATHVRDVSPEEIQAAYAGQ
ncbi:MAG: VOC family protein [Myxococcota bacterium]